METSRIIYELVIVIVLYALRCITRTCTDVRRQG